MPQLPRAYGLAEERAAIAAIGALQQTFFEPMTHPPMRLRNAPGTLFYQQPLRDYILREVLPTVHSARLYGWLRINTYLRIPRDIALRDGEIHIQALEDELMEDLQSGAFGRNWPRTHTRLSRAARALGLV